MSFSKKLISLSFIGVSTLFLSACNPFAPTQENSDQPQTEIGTIEETQKLANAINNGESVVCTMTDTEGNVAEYYVKGEKMKMMGQNISDGEKSGHMINDGEWMYIWEEGKTEGVKNKIPSKEEMEKVQKDSEEYLKNIPDFSDDESVQEYEDKGYTVKCNTQDISDGEFVPPTDVNFVDLEAQMQEAFSGMEKDMGDFKIPEGMNLPEEFEIQGQ